MFDDFGRFQTHFVMFTAHLITQGWCTNEWICFNFSIFGTYLITIIDESSFFDEISVVKFYSIDFHAQLLSSHWAVIFEYFSRFESCVCVRFNTVPMMFFQFFELVTSGEACRAFWFFHLIIIERNNTMWQVQYIFLHWIFQRVSRRI